MFYSLILLALITLCVLFLIWSVRKINKRTLIHDWMKKYNLDKHLPIFNELYKNTNGFLLSKKARDKKDAPEYLYGEIDFLSFIALINLTHPSEKTIFYDLGSGTGKAVIACAMVYNMRAYVGVELFSELHASSISLKKNLSELKDYAEKAEKIAFIQDNFLNRSLRDASVIFINATAFIGETWTQLNQQLDETALGTQVVTITKKLINHNFKLKQETIIQMSWGVAHAYIYEHQDYQLKLLTEES